MVEVLYERGTEEVLFQSKAVSASPALLLLLASEQGKGV